MFSRIVAAILLVVANSLALASDELTPGKPVNIKDGNGILAIDMGATGFATSLHIAKIGSLFGGTTVNHGDASSLHLLELPPGEYRLDRINLFMDFYLRVPDAARYHFKVEPNVVNYPGDIEVAVTLRGLYRFHSVNRAARLMVDIDKAFPGVSARYPVHYQGAFPDTFPEFARRELGSQSADDALTAASKNQIKEVDKDADASLKPLVEELFARPQMQLGRMNLAGDLVATIEYRDGKHRVSVIDMRNDISVDVYRGVNEVDQIRWADDRTLLLSLNAATDNNFVARITANGSAPPTFTTMQVPGRGYFLDVIPHDESHAVFVHADSGGTIHFFPIDLTAKKFDGLQFRGESRLDRGLKQPFFGLLDGEGVLRVVFVLAEGDYALMYRADATAPWAEVRRFTADQTFDPLALSMDGRQLIARTDDGREQIDIVSINLPAGDVANTIFSTPGTDTDGAIISRDDRRVLAAFLYREGRQETAYVDKVSGALREMLQRALPDRDITVLDTSADRHAALVVASSETEPGTYYYLDVTAKHAKQLLTEFPPMPHVHLMASKRIVANAADGISIESYLTLPYQAKSPYPLVVMPHGGPIGIRDALRFDPEVQLLANRGYAVLRVNYRGSGGMGKSFEQAGFGAWGKQIEGDVQSAIDAALKQSPLDASRIAIRGGSYGGYSALMGLIKTPERFRCGIAASAVSDVALMFTSSDWSDNPTSRDRMLRIVGDPNKSMTDLENISPDRLYTKLERPLLLVHGTNDRRVTLEHMLRLLVMLGHAGRPPQWILFSNEAHGTRDPANRYLLEASADKFLAGCLGATR